MFCLLIKKGTGNPYTILQPVLLLPSVDDRHQPL